MTTERSVITDDALLLDRIVAEAVSPAHQAAGPLGRIPVPLGGPVLHGAAACRAVAVS